MKQLDRSVMNLCGELVTAWGEAYAPIQAYRLNKPSERDETFHDWGVRVELMAFFLEVVDREVFLAGGMDARDRLLEALSRRVAELLVRASWPDCDEDFGLGLVNETLHNFNIATMEYSGCESVFGEPTTGAEEGLLSMVDESSCFGRLMLHLGGPTLTGPNRSSVLFSDLERIVAYSRSVMAAIRTSNLVERAQFEGRLLR